MSSHKIGDLLAKVKRPGKVPKSEYLEEGEFPVIDQGKLPIAGYTNNADVVLRSPLPITIFGDHTRAVKFAKTPFACGADGTQLLYPNSDSIDPTFFFYAVKNVDLSNYFYARHFKFLKDQKIELPPLRSQRRIASILSPYDDLIENNRRRIQLLERAARLIYKEWFIHLRFPGHEDVKIIDGVPEGWEKKKIAEVCKTIGGGTPSTKVAQYWGGDITWVIPSDVTKNNCLALLDSERKITETGLRKSSAQLVPANTILMTSRASVGFFALVDVEACTNQGFINIIPHAEEMRMYMLFNLMSRVAEIRNNAKGTTYPEISKGRFRQMDIILPTESLISEFGRLAGDFIRQVRCLKREMAKLTQARDLLLPRLMNGEVAV